MMNKQLSLWQFIAKRLRLQQKVMLLLVTESSGSSPGRQGFKMAVGEENAINGSIGGGIMELKLVELAKKMLKEIKTGPIIKKQIHNKSAPHHQSGMICSGEQTVIYVCLDTSLLPHIRKIIRLLSKYKSAVIDISYIDNLLHFGVLDGMIKTKPFTFQKTGDKEFVWQEMIGFNKKLYIIGGGHCALALSEIMSKFDFYIHVIDDRPGLNTMKQNIYAHEKHVIDDYVKIGEMVASGPDIYVVVMTLGHRSDLIALGGLAEKTFSYLGLLGSDTKVSSIKSELKKTGFPENKLNKMHAPIGLKINSHTPEEIAVSIAGELIKIMNSQ